VNEVLMKRLRQVTEEEQAILDGRTTIDRNIYMQGREIGRNTLRSAGKETCLRALPEQPGVAPGGLSYIRLKYTDGAGLTKPLCRGKLKVEVSGGKLLGLILF